jgi:hypothetical protein
MNFAKIKLGMLIEQSNESVRTFVDASFLLAYSST